MANMEITTRIGCTVSCDYCPQTKLMEAYTKRSNIYHMGFDTFRRCIGKIPRDVTINFFGMCKPWLNSECTKMLLYAYKKGHKIIVYTTLTGMRLSDIDLFEPIMFENFVFIYLRSKDAGE